VNTNIHDNTNRHPHDERWMRAALAEAAAAMEIDDVPVGAVIVHGERVIGRGYNQRELLQDPTAHAEMLALTSAADYLKCWRLTECTMYVTLEPCVMCAGAAVLARIDRIVFGTTDPKAGACGSVYDITGDSRQNHHPRVDGGVLEPECRTLLKTFFNAQRSLGKK
jgi:tRNA(adenine34) deaminase